MSYKDELTYVPGDDEGYTTVYLGSSDIGSYQIDVDGSVDFRWGIGDDWYERLFDDEDQCRRWIENNAGDIEDGVDL